jgi:hypothetical protein
VTDFDTPRLRGAMRAFLRAADALDEAASTASASSAASREVIDKADAKTLAEMQLRKQLEDAGWVSPTGIPINNGD